MVFYHDVTALLMLDEVSSLLFASDGGYWWWTWLCYLSTASFSCTLYRLQPSNHLLQTSNNFVDHSISLVFVVIVHAFFSVEISFVPGLGQQN